MRGARPDPARVRPAVAAAGGVLLALVVGEGARLPMLASLLLALVAAAAGAYLFGAPRPVAIDAPPAAVPPAEAVPVATGVEDDAERRSLRHDLRGILSPAMLMADRLLMVTEDPLAQRAAGAMIDAIERAEKRLAGSAAP